MAKLAVAALVAFGLVGCAAVSPRTEHEIVAHYESPPDQFNAIAPCDDQHVVPKTGICRGTQWGMPTTILSGDWVGHTEYEMGWLTLPSGVTWASVLETFTGTVKPCGTGTMMYRQIGSADAKGNLAFEWEIIPELGTGELTGVTGRGTLRGVSRDDMSSAGEFRGRLRCGGAK
jgi:hypothetical protein